MSASPAPGRLKRRALRYFGTARRALSQDVARELVRRQAVYCGDHVVLTRIKNGRRIYLDMRDASLAPGIALGDEYEPDVAAVLGALARPGDTFFDVGANVGYHSLLLRDAVTKGGGQMHLFEPNPTMHRLLQRTFHANAFWQGVSIRRVALSDREGVGQFTVYEDMWGGARLQDPHELASSNHAWAMSAAVREQFEVPTTTVDQYCQDNAIARINLMKIDVEGHEDAVFAGMSQIAASSPELRVVMEYTFGAYADGAGFWAQLTELFPYRYFIEGNGHLTAVTTLDDLRSRTEIELANIVLSKSAVGTP